MHSLTEFTEDAAPNPRTYDPKRPSRAVIANGRWGGAVLFWVGHELMGLTALADLGLDDAPEGLSIWEGRYAWGSGWNAAMGIDEGGDADPRGAFRALTDAEWSAVRDGCPPWDEHEWLTPEARSDFAVVDRLLGAFAADIEPPLTKAALDAIYAECVHSGVIDETELEHTFETFRLAKRIILK